MALGWDVHLGNGAACGFTYVYVLNACLDTHLAYPSPVDTILYSELETSFDYGKS